jgi:hypothetical protein
MSHLDHGHDSDDSDIVVATRRTTQAKASMDESDQPHQNSRYDTRRRRAGPTLLVKLKIDPRKLPIASTEGTDGIAVPRALNSSAVRGSQDKFDIVEHNVKTGLAEMKQFVEEARAERDLARNRSVGLRTELDMAQARAADLERKLQQAQAGEARQLKPQRSTSTQYGRRSRMPRRTGVLLRS